MQAAHSVHDHDGNYWSVPSSDQNLQKKATVPQISSNNFVNAFTLIYEQAEAVERVITTKPRAELEALLKTIKSKYLSVVFEVQALPNPGLILSESMFTANFKIGEVEKKLKNIV